MDKVIEIDTKLIGKIQTISHFGTNPEWLFCLLVTFISIRNTDSKLLESVWVGLWHHDNPPSLNFKVNLFCLFQHP